MENIWRQITSHVLKTHVSRNSTQYGIDSIPSKTPTNTAEMASNDPIASIFQKIEREKVMIKSAMAMRQSSENAVVQASIDAQIKEARRNLSYLEERLSELQMRRMGQGVDNMSLGQNGNDPRSNSFGQQGGPSRAGYDQGGYGAPAGGGGYMDQLGAGSGMMPPRPPYGAQAPGSSVPKARPNYSKLGIIPGLEGLHQVLTGT